MAERPIGVGLVGFGTVGAGVVRLLLEHRDLVDERLGFPLRLRAIADIDLERDRGVPTSGLRMLRDWRELAADPEIDLVIELVGGTGIARQIALGALDQGRGLITANKALLAHHGAELFERAAARGTDVAFEASVGGTIPVLRALREGLCADRVTSLAGIVNGTCNSILSAMDEDGEPYEVCLKHAQELGLAEADPSFDVNGTDSTHKLAILLALAFGVHAAPDEIHTEGIARVAPLDVEYARRFGLKIKLLALAKDRPGGVEARVHPTMIPARSVLAGVSGAMNAIEIRGRFSGPTLYYGAGAGSLPTASAVVADLMELARARRRGAVGRVPPLGTPKLRRASLVRAQDLEGEYYLRFSALDRPGVLGRLAGALGARGISIASLEQPDRHEALAVPVVMTTHVAREGALRAALEEIEAPGDVTTAPTQVIRIEREL
jgi:homoserine dehydrogenase